MAQGAGAHTVTAGVAGIPPMAATGGVLQQTWPPVQLSELVQEVTVAPGAHWLGLDTQFVAPPTAQQVGIAAGQTIAPQVTATTPPS